jgi:hypothetical protein
MANNTDDFMVDKFIRYVEHRIVNEPNGSKYQIYEVSRGDWVAWASEQEPRVRLPYASRFCRLRLLLRGCKAILSSGMPTGLSIPEQSILDSFGLSTHSSQQKLLLTD